jgi:molecular chaperone HtpG
MSNQAKFKAGMYLLETLTSGMYNEPLSIYREYIQNAVDSIDQAAPVGKDGLVIDITLDPFQKTIVIFDNGEGIPTAQAEKTLSSIGSSEKIGTRQRGFRGIGRLGGVAFAEKAIFRTKAKGESAESIQEWDCKTLRSLLADPARAAMTIEEVFEKVTSFRQEKSGARKNESFFEVTLAGVKSFRNHIFDIAKIKEYLGQVAPLPFDFENFSFASAVNQFLSESLDNYAEYNIRLNGNPVFRPYSDFVKVTNKGNDDVIEGIELLRFEVNGSPIAFGWYGKRKELLGAISKGMGVGGVRVKAGNITIGDEHLLDKCFRENRFNSYIIGEIHVQSPELIPNSRRDDFIDNDMKNLFYNVLERELGLPLSKEVRQRSRLGKDVLTEKTTVAAVPTSVKEAGRNEMMMTENPSVSASKTENFIMQAILSRCKTCRHLEQILQDARAGG